MFGIICKNTALSFFWFSAVPMIAGLGSLLLGLCLFCFFCLGLLVLSLLCKLSILAPALFGRAGLFLCLYGSNNGSAATFSVVEGVKLVGQELAGYRPVLGSRAGGLRFHHYAGGFVEELNCAAGFVL